VTLNITDSEPKISKRETMIAEDCLKACGAIMDICILSKRQLLALGHENGSVSLFELCTNADAFNACFLSSLRCANQPIVSLNYVPERNKIIVHSVSKTLNILSLGNESKSLSISFKYDFERGGICASLAFGKHLLIGTWDGFVHLLTDFEDKLLSSIATSSWHVPNPILEFVLCPANLLTFVDQEAIMVVSKANAVSFLAAGSLA
jgi:hypothetical protein